MSNAWRAASVQESLFGEGDPLAGPEPVLMALNPDYYALFWRHAKVHEFRRRFIQGQPTRWFVYLTAPASRLGPVIDLAPAIVDSPARIAEIADRVRQGNGSTVLEYVKDLDQAFAIPVRRIREYPGLSLAEVRAELGRFHPPQGYVRLRQHPTLLRLCERIAAGEPVREMAIDGEHRRCA
ncbi:hypothetical protein [Micromonospora sp. NPDC005324]|uniref:hypothetical protein n=1 Tax=Micromonospora sp. NPDC005324 TaxID=3157033 RepID=UPI0033AE32A1